MSRIQLVIGSGNQHKIREIRDILVDVPGVALIPFRDIETLPDIDEDGKTFVDNAGKKAHLLAQYLYARRGAAASGRHTALAEDDEDENDDMTLDRIAAARAREQANDALGLDARQGGYGSRAILGGSAPRVRPSDVLVMADDSGLCVDALGGAPGVRSARYAGEHGDDDANNRKLLKEIEGLPDPRRTARFVAALSLASQTGVLFTVEGKVEGRIADAVRGQKGFGYDPLFYYPPYGSTFGEVEADAKNAVSHRANALKLFKSRLMRLLTDEGLA